MLPKPDVQLPQHVQKSSNEEDSDDPEKPFKKPYFSVTSNGKFPLVIFSDGHMVTVVEVPHLYTGLLNVCASLLAESHQTVNTVSQISVTNSLDSQLTNYRDSCSTLNGISEMDFSSRSNLAVEWNCYQLSKTCDYLLAVWGLLVSFNHPWTVDFYFIASKFVDLLCSLLVITPTCAINSAIKCLELLPFDAVMFNMASVSIRLINKVVYSIMKMANLKNLQKSYGFLIRAETRIVSAYGLSMRCSTRNDAFFSYITVPPYFKRNMIAQFVTSTTVQRLIPSWLILYNTATELYSSIDKLERNSFNTIKSIRDIFCQVQYGMQCRGFDIRKSTKGKRQKDSEIQIHLEGYYEKSLSLWINELSAMNKNPGTQKLHRIFYALILYQQLDNALVFVSAALTGRYPCQIQSNSQIRKNSSVEMTLIDSIAKHLKLSGTKNLIKSLARFLSLLFRNEPLVLSPVHKPERLKESWHPGLRVLYPPPISNHLMVSQNLDFILVPCLVVEFLLIPGLWFEASNFALYFGHWRLAFFLAAISSLGNSEQKKSPRILKRQNAIILNELRKTISLPTDSENGQQADQKTDVFNQALRISKVHNILLAAILCNLNPAPTIMSDVLNHLNDLIKTIPLTVPNETYLPAPPYYCPQQCVGCEEGDLPFQDSESGFRNSISGVVMNIFTLIQGANLGIPLLTWYMMYLQILWKADDLDLENSDMFPHIYEAIHNLEEGQSAYLDWSIVESDEGAQQSLQNLRHFFSLLWFLYCRDKLSMATRKLEAYLINLDRPKGRQNPNHHWQLVHDVLEWSECLLPYKTLTKFETTLPLIIINATRELPLSKEIVKLLARCFPETSELSSLVSKRLNDLKERWKASSNSISRQGSSCSQTDNSTLPRTSRRSRKLLDELDKKEDSSVWISFFEKSQIEELRIRSSRKRKVSQAFSNLSSLVINHDEFTYETNRNFLAFLEPVLQIGILKYAFANEIKIPLLGAYHTNLVRQELDSEKDAMELIQKQESMFTGSSSILKVIELFSSQSEKKLVFESQTRQSVLFNQPVRNFWSPSRPQSDRYYKPILTKRNKRFFADKTLVSKWMSSETFFTKCSPQKQSNTSSYVSTALTKSPENSTIVQFTNLLKKKNEIFLSLFYWLYHWTYEELGSESSQLYLSPVQLLLPFVLKSHSTNAVSSPSTPEKKSPVHTDHLSNRSAVPPRENLTGNPKAFDLNKCRMETIPQDSVLQSPVRKPLRFEGAISENELEVPGRSISKYDTIVHSRAMLPQVYQEQWHDHAGTTFTQRELAGQYEEDNENQRTIKHKEPEKAHVSHSSADKREILQNFIRNSPTRMTTKKVVVAIENPTKMQPQVSKAYENIGFRTSTIAHLSKVTSNRNGLYIPNETQSLEPEPMASSPNEKEPESSKTNILHSIPLLKLPKSGSENRPKRYYVKPSDLKMHNNLSKMKELPLLHIEKQEAKSLIKAIDIEKVKSYVTAKNMETSKPDTIKTVLEKRPASIRLTPLVATNKKDKESKDDGETDKIRSYGITELNSESCKPTKACTATQTSEPEPSVPSKISILSPDTFARLQYSVYDRLYRKTETSGTQTTPTVQESLIKDFDTNSHTLVDFEQSNMNLGKSALDSVYDRLYRTQTSGTQTTPTVQESLIKDFDTNSHTLVNFEQSNMNLYKSALDTENQVNSNATTKRNAVIVLSKMSTLIKDPLDHDESNSTSTKRKAIIVPKELKHFPIDIINGNIESKVITNVGDSNQTRSDRLPTEQLNITAKPAFVLREERKSKSSREEIKRSLSHKLSQMQKEMNAIDSITKNIERDIQSTKSELNRIYSSGNNNSDINASGQITPRTSTLSHRSTDSSLFERRKNILISMIESENNYRSTTIEKCSTKRRISFGSTKMVQLPRYRPTATDDAPTEMEEKALLKRRSHSFSGINALDPAQRNELYKIYGSKRISEKFLLKIKMDSL